MNPTETVNVEQEDGTIIPKERPMFDTETIEQIKDNIISIFEKNGITDLNFKVISGTEAQEKYDNNEYGLTDAVITIKNFPRGSGESVGGTDFNANSGKIAYLSSFANYGQFRNSGGDAAYKTGYVAAHEVLHQFTPVQNKFKA